METLLRKYLWVLDLLVIAICAVFSARATATMVETRLSRSAPPPRPAPRAVASTASQTVYSKQEEEILKRNVFCSTCPPILKPIETGGPVDTGPAPPQRTSLPIQLLAIMFAPPPASKFWSIAIIRDTDAKSAGPYQIGSKIRDATITDISPTRVDLDVQGREEYIELFDKGPGAAPAPVAAAQPVAAGGDALTMEMQKGIKKTGENSYEVQRGTVDSLLGNMSALSRAARIVPEIRDGKAAGFRLFSVQPNGPFGLIGLQNGDVISAINGLEMSSPDQALMVYTKLKSASHLSVGLERNGQKVTKEYNIR
jgi:general secretion pathway protein C